MGETVQNTADTSPATLVEVPAPSAPKKGAAVTSAPITEAPVPAPAPESELPAQVNIVYDGRSGSHVIAAYMDWEMSVPQTVSRKTAEFLLTNPSFSVVGA